MSECGAVLERLRGRYLAPVVARETRRHRDVLLARLFGRQVSPCESDQILIGRGGHLPSQEVFIVDVLSWQGGTAPSCKIRLHAIGCWDEKDGRPEQEGER